MDKANWLPAELGIGAIKLGMAPEVNPELAADAAASHEVTASDPAALPSEYRVLVIDSDRVALDELCSQLRACPRIGVHSANDAGGAIRMLSAGFDLLLIDVELRGASALEVVEAAFAQRVSPAVVAMGLAPDAESVFELAKAGVHAYVRKPVQLAQVEACLVPFDLDLATRRLLRPFVGHLGMKDIQSHVREALVREALERTGGSRRSAAQLLGVTRPAIQRWLRRS
jgi:two-component system, response regulator RegA